MFWLNFILYRPADKENSNSNFSIKRCSVDLNICSHSFIFIGVDYFDSFFKMNEWKETPDSLIDLS
ncbi:hypothetical protein LEP1GSC058_3876 [Leptospira fainei serovar Hurstbridge str. BUT 6]|uniref:Uncharacterized protein n=1 Tax=Leptospira fainei serovar Hurstbridge str. BUT 6 TaxID=1193011 RepID=S3UYI9_9LEPT|nr:hypothetical protein LEP1GSC058_3876 [Leptospira fainei serovar Hurstbridge str. BUT 6]